MFQSHRPRLFGVAYRMLGSRADAEDLLQDAYLRWHQSATEDIQSPIAFLVTITTADDGLSHRRGEAGSAFTSV